MPAFGNRLSADEIKQVSAYVVELSVSGPPQTTPTTVPVGEGTASVGEDIFRGSTLLSNGGIACAACHSAGVYDRLGGPGMAIDLNGIVDDFGKAGFIDAIVDPVVDPMIAVFADHQITDQEAADLAAYLETTKAGQPSGSSIDLLLLLGFSGFLVLILVTALVIRGPQNAYVEKLRSTR
jgi:mono/diheme cytochrome c family protein